MAAPRLGLSGSLVGLVKHEWPGAFTKSSLLLCNASTQLEGFHCLPQLPMFYILGALLPSLSWLAINNSSVLFGSLKVKSFETELFKVFET